MHSQQTFTIGVILDSPPVVTAGHTLAYTENQVATAIDPALTVGDPDSANLAHATVQIIGNYVNGEDVLGFTNQNGITGSFDAATGTLTLTGSASVANYQTALASVTYFNTSDNPSAAGPHRHDHRQRRHARQHGRRPTPSMSRRSTIRRWSPPAMR